MAAITGIATQAKAGGVRRNRNFEDTHRLLIEKAVDIISRRRVGCAVGFWTLGARSSDQPIDGLLSF